MNVENDDGLKIIMCHFQMDSVVENRVAMSPNTLLFVKNDSCIFVGTGA